jgi:hypothetical protein
MLPADMSSTMLPPGGARRKPSAWSPRAALTFVLLFGAVNLFADMSYEGARSVTGPFLGSLGASGLIVGSVAGFGELLGYTLRYVAMGSLYDVSIPAAVWVAVVAQLLAIAPLLMAANYLRARITPTDPPPRA